MTIVSLVSIKGGVGKSTLTASLATAVARRLSGQRVAAIDLDPQNSLSWHLGLGGRRSQGVANSATSASPPPMLPSPNGVRCAPFGDGTDAQCLTFQNQLAADSTWLSELVRNSGEHSIAFVDTPSGRSVFARHAMQSSRIVLAIVQPDAASYATIADMEASLNQHAAQADCYYLLNRYEPREAFAIDTTALLREQFGDRLAPIAISRDEGFREALALQQTSLQYDPHSQASHDIDQLSRWLLERLSRAGQR